MGTPGISNVLFDIGNVIVRSTHKITEAILWELGVRPDKAALFFHGKHYGDFARGKCGDGEFTATVRRAVEVPHLTGEQIRAAHDAHIYMVDGGVVARIASLKENNVPLAFVTTTNVWQTARELELINLGKQFGPVVRSHEIGMTKTDPDAWPKILGELEWDDRDPSTILLVDDAEGNCDAAKRAGLCVHQYDPTLNVGVTALWHELIRLGLLS